MKYDDETQQYIIDLSNDGMSGRKIAELMNLSKSGVNDFLNRRLHQQVKSSGGPKVLFLDVETAPNLAVAFNRFNVNLTPDHIVEEGNWLLTAAWQWLHKDEVQSLALTSEEASNQDDSYLSLVLHQLFDEADIVVAHNGKRFDVPLIKSRILANGYDTPHAPRIIDTLVIARSMKFSSNKLDSLCHSLDIGRKMKHHGIRLWIECMQGDEEALAKMEEYNRQDIELLRELYFRIRAYDKTGPNFGQYYDDDHEHCPTCGGIDLKNTGNFVYNGSSKFEEVQCKDCGHRSRRKSSVNSSQHRKNLLQRSV